MGACSEGGEGLGALLRRRASRIDDSLGVGREGGADRNEGVVDHGAARTMHILVPWLFLY